MVGYTSERQRILNDPTSSWRDAASAVDWTVAPHRTLGRLPKTQSGTILRKTKRQIVDGRHCKIPATIEDPLVLDALADAVLGTADTGIPAR